LLHTRCENPVTEGVKGGVFSEYAFWAHLKVRVKREYLHYLGAVQIYDKSLIFAVKITMIAAEMAQINYRWHIVEKCQMHTRYYINYAYVIK